MTSEKIARLTTVRGRKIILLTTLRYGRLSVPSSSSWSTRIRREVLFLHPDWVADRFARCTANSNPSCSRHMNKTGPHIFEACSTLRDWTPFPYYACWISTASPPPVSTEQRSLALSIPRRNDLSFSFPFSHPFLLSHSFLLSFSLSHSFCTSTSYKRSTMGIETKLQLKLKRSVETKSEFQ